MSKTAVDNNNAENIKSMTSQIFSSFRYVSQLMTEFVLAT